MFASYFARNDIIWNTPAWIVLCIILSEWGTHAVLRFVWCWLAPMTLSWHPDSALKCLCNFFLYLWHYKSFIFLFFYLFQSQFSWDWSLISQQTVLSFSALTTMLVGLCSRKNRPENNLLCGTLNLTRCSLRMKRCNPGVTRNVQSVSPPVRLFFAGNQTWRGPPTANPGRCSDQPGRANPHCRRTKAGELRSPPRGVFNVLFAQQRWPYVLMRPSVGVWSWILIRGDWLTLVVRHKTLSVCTLRSTTPANVLRVFFVVPTVSVSRTPSAVTVFFVIYSTTIMAYRYRFCRVWVNEQIIDKN